MLDTVRQWQGTAESLTEEIKHQIKELKLSVEAPAIRTVRLWRSKSIFSQPQKQKFGFRQILEGLATALLLKKGWTLAAIAQVLPSLSNIDLEQQILAEAEGKETIWIPDSLVKDHRQQIDLAENSVVLLAQGIIRLYRKIDDDKKIVKQDDDLPTELYQGMCKLGRLYIENGQIDQAASVHQILNLARFPLKNEQWNLPIFQQPEFSYRDVILIDPQLCVPTSECETIAHNYGGFGEDNLIERRLFNQLKDSTEKLEKLGSRRQHLAYTKIRELLGRFSLIGQRKLFDYVEEHDLTPLQRVISEFFIEVPDIWLIKNLAHRCANCGTLMRPHYNPKRYPDGQCPIVQCSGHLNPKIGEKLDPNKDQLLVAKPQILTYWTAPAIDELAIYDIAKKEGLEVELYPNSDRCDIGINNRFIGIDAKSYNSPVALAAKLNHSIGGLIHYNHRIIAISDRLIIDNPYYLDILRERLEPKNPQSTLQIMSVAEIIQKLKERYYEK